MEIIAASAATVTWARCCWKDRPGSRGARMRVMLQASCSSSGMAKEAQPIHAMITAAAMRTVPSSALVRAEVISCPVGMLEGSGLPPRVISARGMATRTMSSQARAPSPRAMVAVRVMGRPPSQLQSPRR